MTACAFTLADTCFNLAVLTLQLISFVISPVGEYKVD